METDFPSTVPTVTRTIQKVPLRTFNDTVQCAFCMGNNLKSDALWRQKHTLSHLESQIENENESSLKSLNVFCYSCQNMMHDATTTRSDVSLPDYLKHYLIGQDE